MNQIRQIYFNSRILFVIDGCPHCMNYKRFIERLNLELPFEKRIRVINATVFNTLGIVDDPMIGLFDKYIDGYPTLFLNGIKITGANSQEEAEAFIKAAVHKDFIVPRDNPYLFDKDCRYSKNKFGRKILTCK